MYVLMYAVLQKKNVSLNRRTRRASQPASGIEQFIAIARTVKPMGSDDEIQARPQRTVVKPSTQQKNPKTFA
jgi:hypothetical protein